MTEEYTDFTFKKKISSGELNKFLKKNIENLEMNILILNSLNINFIRNSLFEMSYSINKLTSKNIEKLSYLYLEYALNSEDEGNLIDYSYNALRLNPDLKIKNKLVIKDNYFIKISPNKKENLLDIYENSYIIERDFMQIKEINKFIECIKRL